MHASYCEGLKTFHSYVWKANLFFLFGHAFENVFKGWSSAMKALQYIVISPFPHSEKNTNVHSFSVLVQCMCSSIVEVPLTCLVVDVNGLATLGLAIIIAVINHTFYVRMFYEAGPVPPRNVRFLVGWGDVPLGDNRLCWVLPILKRYSRPLMHIQNGSHVQSGSSKTKSGTSKWHLFHLGKSLKM